MAIFTSWGDGDDDGEESVNSATKQPNTDSSTPIYPTPPESGLPTLSARSGNDAALPCSPARASTNLPALAAAWPVISSIAFHLDHSDLACLASVCKQMRQNMLPYRKALLNGSLQCTATRNVTMLGIVTRRQGPPCVKDLVARCYSCDEPTCRNCISKRSDDQTPMLLRLRKLCTKCQTNPAFLPGNPGFKLSLKICRCSRNSWQCITCISRHTHKVSASSTYDRHEEKLRLIQYLNCPHFRSDPPSSACKRVWVEPCPGPEHMDTWMNHPLGHVSSKYNIALEHRRCVMEKFTGWWAWKDTTTGQIARPTNEDYRISGHTEWTRLTYGSLELVCYDDVFQDPPRSNQVADEWFGRLVFWRGSGIQVMGLPEHRMFEDVEPCSTLLDKEKSGELRSSCDWCHGIVYSKKDEQYIETTTTYYPQISN
ncbi:hypothetical protein BDZ91DRAFT_780976 [Kalaharituber pfeilii]|nr:hypothetical protein BDZ91DRAFT_780976 [Kalaharituber pfeilii]